MHSSYRYASSATLSITGGCASRDTAAIEAYLAARVVP